MSDAAPKPTACLALADGTIFYGKGFGASGTRVAELCFNTAMTGYQEIMTDPSYAGQIVTFTFPHIGNTGITPEDDETADPVADGLVVKWDPTEPSNWRATAELTDWLERRGRAAERVLELEAHQGTTLTRQDALMTRPAPSRLRPWTRRNPRRRGGCPPSRAGSNW